MRRDILHCLIVVADFFFRVRFAVALRFYPHAPFVPFQSTRRIWPLVCRLCCIMLVVMCSHARLGVGILKNKSKKRKKKWQRRTTQQITCVDFISLRFVFFYSTTLTSPFPTPLHYTGIELCLFSVQREREREWARYLHRVLPSIERRAHGWVEYVIIIAYVTYLISFFFRLAFSVNPRQTNESKSMWNFHKQQQQQQRAGELLCRTRYGICHCSAR